MTIQTHNSTRLAKPVGPFSHAVRVGDLVYLSGQAGQEPSGTLVPGGVREQTQQIFRNFRVLLEDLDLTFNDVVKVNVFLAEMGDFEAMNRIYAEHFAGPCPARTTVAVKQLPLEAVIEIEMIVKAHR